MREWWHETPKCLLCGYLTFAWPCYTGGSGGGNYTYVQKHEWFSQILNLTLKKKMHDVKKTLIWKDTGIPMFTAEQTYNSQDTETTQVSFNR